MNEEEKKAVEDIKELKTLFEIDDKKDFEATPFVQKEIAKDLKVLLNIIDKMKNCINILDDELKERNKTINKKGIIIEKLQKENEELNLKYYMLYTGKIENLKAQEVKIKSQVIPVQKVKDKIEELQNGPLKINENNKYYYETEAYNKIIIQVLQELLEGRK